MSLWFILLASCMASGLIVAAVLLWVGINAMLHQHRLMGEPPITIASLGPALRSIYDSTARESLPADFLDLLRKLTNKAPLGRRLIWRTSFPTDAHASF